MLLLRYNHNHGTYMYYCPLKQRFSNHGSRPKCGSPKLCGWVAKACKLPHEKEKDLGTQDFKSEDPFLRERYDFKTKIKKSESDSR